MNIWWLLHSRNLFLKFTCQFLYFQNLSNIFRSFLKLAPLFAELRHRVKTLINYDTIWWTANRIRLFVGDLGERSMYSVERGAAL